ncbi:hypothetical protein JCM30566_16590 [Marinitoga arctica]
MKKNPFENLKKQLLLKEKINHYVVFKVDNILYALKANIVKEIISSTEKRELPNTPEYIIGVINNDNQPITLIDLKRILKDEYQNYKEEKMYIISFNYENKRYGFFSNEVDVVSVDSGSLSTPGEELKEFYFVDEVFSLSGEIFLVINVEKILKSSE